MLAARTAAGTARGSFPGQCRLVAIDGFEVDLPDSAEDAAGCRAPRGRLPLAPTGWSACAGGVGERRPARLPWVAVRRPITFGGALS